MITHIKGKLIEKNPTDVVIDCNGVGYFINISLHTFSQLLDTENVALYTQLLVREDAHTLYGFYSKQERMVFNMLISVSGIGASIARTMLSSLSPEQISQAIIAEDVATIQSIKGIGSKTAQRAVLDLKDKMINIAGETGISPITSNTNRNEALSALETLGFARKQAEKVCNNYLKQQPQASVEQIIKEALKNL